MPAQKTLVEEILSEWYEVRKGVIAEVKNIPPTRFTFRPTLESRSMAEFVQHIIELAIMTTEELAREDTNFQRLPPEQLAHTYAPNISHADTKEKLLDLLVEQYRDAEQKFRSVGELHLLQYVTEYDGARRTRLAILNRNIAHEMYHRGQLALCARLLGLEPALTRSMRLTHLGADYSQDR